MNSMTALHRDPHNYVQNEQNDLPFCACGLHKRCHGLRPIDDVVAEFEFTFCHEVDGEVVVTCFEPKDCTTEDWSAWQLKDWLTQTLTAERQAVVEMLEEVMKIDIGDTSPTRIALSEAIARLTNTSTGE